MNLSFATVDVFTDRPFGGNPLAVVPDARGMTHAQMQALAAEFNLSETAFVLPPQNPAHTAQVRIFTPRAELPFAGHPNIGTAFVLATTDGADAARLAGDTMSFEEQAGLVAVTLMREGATVTGARLAAPQGLAIGETICRKTVAAACSLAPDDIDTRVHEPCIASCGVPLVFAAVVSRAALAAATPRNDVFAKDIAVLRAVGIHLYVPAPPGPHVRAALWGGRGPGNGCRQRRSGRASRRRRPAPRRAAGTPDFAGCGHGPAEPSAGVGREAGRRRCRRLCRGTLRAGYARYHHVVNSKHTVRHSVFLSSRCLRRSMAFLRRS